MSQQQNPLERAVDLFVFAPIGVAMFAKDTVPTFLKMFVSRGQTEIASRKKSLHDQANQYRTVGKFAVKYGGPVVKRQAEDRFDDARRVAEETFSGLVVPRIGGAVGTPPVEDAPPKTAPKTKKVDKPARVETTSESITNGARSRAKNGSAKTRTSNGDATKADDAAARQVEEALAIPEYDQLSASQVVERLDGLTPAELDAVRAYELAHRGRNTILGKITQLTG